MFENTSCVQIRFEIEKFEKKIRSIKRILLLLHHSILITINI